MNTAIIKTSELEGKALDWATGIAAGFKMSWNKITGQPTAEKNMQLWTHWEPSISWNQCGPLIDEYDIGILGPEPGDDSELIAAGINWYSTDGSYGEGATVKIAACRALVAAKLGNKVEVPVIMIEEVQS